MTRRCSTASPPWPRRSPGYAEAHPYHDGTVNEVFGSRLVQRRLARQGRPFRVNVIKSVVDARADRLELVSATVPGDDAASDAARRHHGRQRHRVRVGQRASPGLRVRRLLRHGVAGRRRGGRRARASSSTATRPLGMRVVYDPDNPRRKLYAVQAWEVGRPPAGQPNHWRVNLLYPDRVERWRTKPGSKPTDVDGWEPVARDGGPRLVGGGEPLRRGAGVPLPQRHAVRGAGPLSTGTAPRTR